MRIFFDKMGITFIHDSQSVNMKILFLLLLIPLFMIPAFAETQTLPTDKGTLDVKLTHDPIEPDVLTKMNIDFINPQTQKTQVHIDYSVVVSKDGETVFGPTQLIHTSEGEVNIPIDFNRGEGMYSMDVEVEGILFSPIPPESVSFDILVGEAQAQPITPPESNVNEENGGCLIATATYGSELAPQVQQLRELRDNTILSTESGMAFMSTFNQFYYSFSPSVADFEREQPVFKEFMKISLTPMLTSLSLLNHVNIDSEEEMLGYGISIVLLNIGMYVGIPLFGILKLYQFKKD